MRHPTSPQLLPVLRRSPPQPCSPVNEHDDEVMVGAMLHHLGLQPAHLLPPPDRACHIAPLPRLPQAQRLQGEREDEVSGGQPSPSPVFGRSVGC